MNPEVKRRIVMSLVSLALAFGLLATYYIVTVPWNRNAVGQALTAGAILGISALVVQFMPIRAPAPIAASQQKPEPVEQLAPRRTWQAEPDFGAEDFQHDLAAAPGGTTEPVAVPVAPVPVSVPAAAMTPVVAAQVEEPAPKVPKAPDAVAPEAPAAVPAPEPIIPQMPTVARAAQTSSIFIPEVLERALEAADQEAASDVLSLDEIKDSAQVLIGRNDDVRVHVEETPVAATPTITVQPYRAEPARAAPIHVATPASSVAPSASPDRQLPGLKSPKVEWREPDPETPKELLRELAEYWHVKYETERKRHNQILAQYDDVVRRLENLETAAALGTSNNSIPRIVDESALPLDEISVADATAHEGKNDLEDRWDRRAAQMERFH